MFKRPVGAGFGGRSGSRAFTPVLVALVAACEDPQPPAACSAIPEVTIHTGESATVTACFSDPNEDVLAYSVTSSNAGVAQASIAGTVITVRAAAPGRASVDVTATDPDGLQGQQSFQVIVPNRSPLANGTIPPITVAVGATDSVDATPWFTEPDGEALVYSATSSNPAVATVAVSDSTVRITAVAKGITTVAVTATDPGGLGTTQDFQTMVPNRQPVAAGTMPDRIVEVDEPVAVDLSPYFDDPDGDTLTYTARSSSPGLATVSATGSTPLITAVAKGTTTVTVTATDPESLEATQTFQSTIPNRPPGPRGTIPEQTLYLGDTVTVDLSPYFDDPDGDALTYAAASSNSGVAATVSGSTVTVTAVAKGTTTVSVTAMDPEGLDASQTFQSTIPNRPPGPTGTIPEQTLHLGDRVTVDLSPYFDDPDGDALTYAATSTDTAVATASVSGSTLAIAAVARGTTTVTVTATDPEGLDASQTFRSTIPNRPPGPIGTIPEQTPYLGDTVTVDLSPYFDDPDGDPLAYAAASSSAGVATVTVSGSTVTVAAVAKGTTTVTVTASDPEGLEAMQTFESRVPNRPPGPVGTFPDRTLHIGDTITADLSSHFDDPDGDPLTYTASSSHSVVAAAAVSGSTVTITAFSKGATTVTVTATDPEGLAATQSFGSTVPNRPPNPVGTVPDRTVRIGKTIAARLPSHFDDPDGDSLTYTAASSNTAVATVSVSGSSVTIAGVAVGSATITLTARDPDGLPATQQAGVTVRQANRAPRRTKNIPARTLAPGGTAVINASRHFDDPDGDDLTYGASTSNSDVARVSVSGSTVRVRAVGDGSATITVSARDPSGLTATQRAAVRVRANRAPQPAGTIPALELTPGETATIDASDYFDDPDGDALAYMTASSNSNVSTASVAGSIVTVTAVADGRATITVTAQDPGGLTAIQEAGVTVTQANRAPRSVGGIPPMAMAPGDTAAIDASGYFTDPDGDALAYAAASSGPGVATASVSGSAVTVRAIAAGSATISVTAQDPDGLTATQQFGVAVARNGPGFRDDFSSSASLDDWSLTRATAEVNNGVLELTKTNPAYTGTASRVLASPITSWTLAIRMGREQASDSAVALVWRTGHSRYTFAGFHIMEDNHYFLLVYDSESNYWNAIADASGTSDAIQADAGELTTITISFIDGQLQGVAGSTELFNYQTNSLGSAIFARVGFSGPGTAVWLFVDGVGGTTGLFDWVDISGDPVGNSLLADESADASIIDASLHAGRGPDLMIRSARPGGASPVREESGNR
ncbi:MAG: Ig-like domain-containing protein [Gemmatimonadota bacterium]|nr:Ig-like domain-containing protein [Gemmatimonadota bacterium]MDE2983353.1 Ig-like domain-containing protein [Gemmatimonadota bacterium]